MVEVIDSKGLATLFCILNKPTDGLLWVICILIGRNLLHRHDLMPRGLVEEGIVGQLLRLSGTVQS